MAIRALAVSDQIDPRIYSASLKERMPDVQIVFGCGDIPARYLEFLADALDRPVYFVLGNHLEELTRLGERGKHYEPMGSIDLGGRVVRDPFTGLILAGLPGSPKYSDVGTEQYSEGEILWKIARMAPRLLWNRLRYGRALDVLITHSPPRDVNDRPDPAHRGFKAIRRFLDWFKPAYQLHGHVHLYDRSIPFATRYGETCVINVYPYQVVDIDAPVASAPARTLAEPS
jgi:Icc-related predicted phosphoesterase